MSVVEQETIVDVQVSMQTHGVALFQYSQEGTELAGDVVVDAATKITYRLMNSPGFSFVGAGFLTPNDGIVETATVSDDGQSLVLLDLDQKPGLTKFHLILNQPYGPLLLLSPDPQVINKRLP